MMIGMVVALPALSVAQEAVVSGIVRDATGGVLPGVTLVARNGATGNTFESVTNELGAYRIGVRPGAYSVTARLLGFTDAVGKLAVLLGQQATLDLQLRLAGVEETLTVTGEASLVNVAISRPSGSIDPRQMEELPVNGRQFQNLSLLAPGSRANSVSEAPVERGFTGSFQINLDGQQVTNNIAGSAFGNPKFSHDSVAEFEFVANRFEATQGRSMGAQLNAISKSDTNTFAGTAAGYFRNDRFIAKDFIADRVLPYSNQQISLTHGGPSRSRTTSACSVSGRRTRRSANPSKANGLRRSSMRVRSVVIGLFIMIGIVSLPALSLAQESTVSGIVSDPTGGVLPGVSVVARNEATGNTFESVTNQLGAYRIQLPPGPYSVTGQLAGFSDAVGKLEVLLAQQATLNLQLRLAGVEETLTVTGEAPLVNVGSTRSSGNIDPRQMQEIPVNGRQFQNLSLLAPGSRANSVGEAPVENGCTGCFQINLDGQQVTNNIASSAFGNPKFSQDSIAEFEFVANRFDATQGKSMGAQLNAITKSGTNTFEGTAAGYFRDDRFIAKDFIADRVLPYSNQQISLTHGGPISQDRIHYFANYEYERRPRTFTHTTPYPSFNIDLIGTEVFHKAGGRVDVQTSTQTRLTGRYSRYDDFRPHEERFVGGATNAPSTDEAFVRFHNSGLFTMTQVLSNRSLNEVKGGLASYGWEEYSYVRWPDSPARGKHHARPEGTGWGSPRINLLGLTMGPRNQAPEDYNQLILNVRDNFSTSFVKGGTHDLKLGAEYARLWMIQYVCRACVGQLDANIAPPPANLPDLFPDLYDYTTWNLAPLSPISRQFQQGVGIMDYTVPRHTYGFWAQDNWRVNPRLTLNLGVRYDFATNEYENSIDLGPFLRAGRPADLNNVAPRLGMAFSPTDRTVIRGGWGLFFIEYGSPHPVRAFSLAAVAGIQNDGRPDFASDPWGGRPVPTYEEVIANGCDVSSAPDCIYRDVGTTNILSPEAHNSYSHQASVGVEQQLSDTLAVGLDYVYQGERELGSSFNDNLSYNPDTGANYPATDVSRRPWQGFGLVGVNWQQETGFSNYHSLLAQVTKRMSHGFQLSANYTLGMLKNQDPFPRSGGKVIPFPLQPDFGGEYTLASTDQRHRAVANGIWQLKYGFQLSGVYFYGSGLRYSTNFGGNFRVTNGSYSGRLRRDGTIVPRNNLVGEAIHRMDVRIQRRFGIGERRSLDLMLEVFNAFNHANYGSYTTQESNRNYGLPSQNANVAFQPRMLQFGVRLAF